MNSLMELDNQITFWVPLTNNGTGGKTWSAGVNTPAKLADTTDLVTQPNGKQIMASKMVFSKIETPVGAYIIEGDQSGQAVPTTGSQQVIKFVSNPLTDLFHALLT